jgi:hypothetical protein
VVKGIRIVAPFKPFPAECGTHQQLEREGFDWDAAIAMLIDTARAANEDCPVHVLTDRHSPMSVPALRYDTTSNRLMVWAIEVCLHYLRSRDFDRNTVMLDCDQLIFGNLRKWFKKTPQVDLGVLVRPHGKHIQEGGEPLLNGVQFWHRSGRRRLVALYEQCLDVVQQLPEHRIAWGGDTDALRQLIEPIEIGVAERSGAFVQMWPAEDVLESWSSMHTSMLEAGQVPTIRHAVLDFRAMRKRYMAPMYHASRQAVIE